MNIEKTLKQDSSKTDEELISLCKAGDKKFYHVLVERYKDMIYNLISRYTKNPDIADEITQETFVKAWKAINSFEGRSKFSTWLITIAVNRVKDELKYKKRFTTLEFDSISNNNPYESSNDMRGPEEMVMNNELGAQLKSAINNLPGIYKEAFLLRHVELLSYDEISDITNTSSETVKVRVFRARDMLKKILYKEEKDG
ncbi:MAG: sigma-70 family RNA polymerase sigma factor [Deltaproteobacteria bacterium]|nr:sigma-70 family RNA polymerase sigma factor [Deltaproteobacteria bacterium]MCL5791948.1 sigma-70 family RNA polymerase sigma factor [Deltaproteobacteria bacterium]